MPPPLETIRKARRLRRAMTLPEVLIWQRLRRSSGSVKFRRQHPIGPFVLDFYCPSARTAIEIDGIAHDMGDNPVRDRARDEWLRTKGITVIRIPARDVLRSVEDVVGAVVRACAGL
ncbi:Very-short-patch-repair endonuclease [Novosphingobium sp. CF614]|uniref:endonuclease domain-containing protein n=1 Tax=Novosphingobium sp. CF614 TaxID=1884364 RepID=UPI0008F23E74|nr:endonuclease domain-containing protein [Novosphingobium sp. CF614]SFF95542.1 Very-short-patch-repair endonuclease [Novosphingobium sp. CF614]